MRRRIGHTIMAIGAVLVFLLACNMATAFVILTDRSMQPMLTDGDGFVSGNGPDPFIVHDIYLEFTGMEELELSEVPIMFSWFPYPGPTWIKTHVYTFEACTDTNGEHCTQFLLQVCDSGRHTFEVLPRYSLNGIFVEVKGWEGKYPFAGCEVNRISRDHPNNAPARIHHAPGDFRL